MASCSFSVSISGCSGISASLAAPRCHPLRMISRNGSFVRNRTLLHIIALFVACLSLHAFAQQSVPAAPPPNPDMMAPLPAEAHVDQTIQLGGRALKYIAAVG